MCRLSEDDLEIAEDGEVWIKTSRKKTKIDYELPLLDIPLRILDKYRGIAPEGKLLLCLLPFAAGAQDGRQRTVETVVADVLAQLPAGQTATTEP